MITRNLLERAIDLLDIASDDATRYHICGVLIEAKAVKGSDLPSVKMVATNGYTLAERFFNEAMPQGVFFLRDENKAPLKLILKECKRMSEIPAEVNDAGALVVGLTTKVVIEKHQGDYPDYKRVIPKHAEKVAITINAEYLYTLAKVLQDGEKRRAPTIRIEFDPSKPLSPALIHAIDVDSEEHRLVVMPCRDAVSTRIARDNEEKRNPKKGDAA